MRVRSWAVPQSPVEIGYTCQSQPGTFYKLWFPSTKPRDFLLFLYFITLFLLLTVIPHTAQQAPVVYKQI